MDETRKTCAGCGSVYVLTSNRILGRIIDSIECEICGAELHKWSGAETWSAELVERPSAMRAAAQGNEQQPA
jgi:ribosomal protein S27E